jgi:hypothetical protein
MGMITSIRAPVPVAQALTPPATEPRPPGTTQGGSAAPVAAAELTRAIQQAQLKSVANDPQLVEARMTAETSAAVAAEAARDAYIKTSIPAGINPLPLS